MPFATTGTCSSFRGTKSGLTRQAVSLTVDKFPLEALAAFLPKLPKATGLLAVKAKITGTAAAPEIDGTIKLTDSTIGGQNYAGLVADLS